MGRVAAASDAMGVRAAAPFAAWGHRGLQGQAHFVGALFPTGGGAAAPEELPAPFAADVRVACLQSQSTPLLSIHDLDRSLKQQGGYAKVQWGDSSSLTVCDGSVIVDIPLERAGPTFDLAASLTL